MEHNQTQLCKLSFISNLADMRTMQPKQATGLNTQIINVADVYHTQIFRIKGNLLSKSCDPFIFWPNFERQMAMQSWATIN